MHNPFAKPHTLGQWLLGSLCWTLSCVGGWIAISTMVLEVPYDQKTPSGPLFFISFAIAYATMLWKTVPGLKAVEKGASWFEMLAFVWQMTLVAFQLIWLIGMLLVLASLFFYDPTQELLRQ